MPEFDIDALLSPLPGEDPCGPDLEYDAAFQALQAAAAGKPERQYGSTIIAAEPPDWAAVHQQACALALRTRDLRVATWLVRSGAHVAGLVGAVRGLQLLLGWLERYWEQVHPVLDPLEGHDPAARLNALWPLHHEAGLADLRGAALNVARPAITVRTLELAFGRAEPMGAETVPTQEAAVAAIAAAQAETPDLVEAMRASLPAVQRIAEILDARLGGHRSPDLGPLVDLLRPVAECAGRLEGGEGSAPNAGAASAVAPAAIVAGGIASREDAIHALERVAEWIERHEPTNPAPLLILRAQRLMKKNFMEIIRDLVPDGIGQIEKLAGTPHD